MDVVREMTPAGETQSSIAHVLPPAGWMATYRVHSGVSVNVWQRSPKTIMHMSLAASKYILINLA